MKDFSELPDAVVKAAEEAEAKCRDAFKKIDAVCECNTLRMLKAFTDNRVSAAHMSGSTGYGYDDAGRDTLDRVAAQVFGCEDALVRHNFVSGTHALSVALFGVLRPGDEVISVTGKPYDTLDEVIGVNGATGDGSLRDFGVKFKFIELTDDGHIDVDAAVEAINENTKMIYVQRSGGYSVRAALLCRDIQEISAAAKARKSDVIVMVDNCYGEFTQTAEPVAVGADLMAGSLIKNAGGGLCETGGYIAGKAELVRLCAYRLTVVGQGKEIGCTLGQLRYMYQGFFTAPEVTAAAMKTGCFASAFLELLGLGTFPKPDEERGDILTVIETGTRERLIEFVKGIQEASPVDSFVTPEPWAMPGYSDEVIMAAGAFTQGASIEISCDAPIRPPYACYLQGGITYFSGKAAVMQAAAKMYESEKKL